ncbi:MAG: hypothetical protein AT711_06085 [Thermoproteus sp. CIS_19]|jgi:hypothetical protein|nr:MAG: hypothetical protein AT711_06085 [Thermoproteus sp. CIS_19]
MLGDLDRFVRLADMQGVDDRVAGKFVAPALELIVLDKALGGELDREGGPPPLRRDAGHRDNGRGSVGAEEGRAAVGGDNRDLRRSS